MSLIFATGNTHKAQEVSLILNTAIQTADKKLLASTPPETGITFAENALIKANYIFEQTGKPCFAEDSGLCVEVLGGAPGIYSARFAGEEATDEKNNLLLLEKLFGGTNRKANFTAVICYMDTSGHHFFEGKVFGRIADKLNGKGGFGYDPLFIPDGYDKTFAELGSEVKNTISHRKKALEGLREFLVLNVEF